MNTTHCATWSRSVIDVKSGIVSNTRFLVKQLTTYSTSAHMHLINQRSHRIRNHLGRAGADSSKFCTNSDFCTHSKIPSFILDTHSYSCSKTSLRFHQPCKTEPGSCCNPDQMHCKVRWGAGTNRISGVGFCYKGVVG